jgi:hypothetical protein
MMAWHEDLPIEVAVEFQRLTPTLTEFVESALWVRCQYGNRAWSDHSRWWRSTAAGKRYLKEYQRKRTERLQRTTAAIRGCVSCGKLFELTAYRQERRRDRVCSPQCRGAARRNIEQVTVDGRSQSLARWAKEYGLPLGTVWARIKRGWDVQRALTTPVQARCTANMRALRTKARQTVRCGIGEP